MTPHQARFALTPRRLAALSIVLAVAVSAILLAEAAWARRPNPRSIHFQRLVGGLGWGFELDASRCWAAFDPRLSGICSYETGPLPGGQAYCPYHGRIESAGRALAAPSVTRDDDARSSEVRHD